MAYNAVFGFVGVIPGSLTTSVLTVYRERLTTRREKAAATISTNATAKPHATPSRETASWPCRRQSQT